MAHQSNHRWSSGGVMVKSVLIVLGCLFLFCYVVGPSLFWRSRAKMKSRAVVSCPRCSCDCISELELSSDTFNKSSSDCSSEDPEMNEEMKKDLISLLSEEISLQKNVTRYTLEHTQVLIMESRRTSSQYENEATKCNAVMRTCEDARQRAEAALAEERKLTVQWEERARNAGWTDEKKV